MTDLASRILDCEKYLLHIHRSPDNDQLMILDKLIADDFIEFAASGKVLTKADLLNYAQQRKFKQSTISIDNFQLKKLADEIVLATYRAVKVTESAATPLFSHRSSIWRLMIGQQWQICFHQGTLEQN